MKHTVDNVIPFRSPNSHPSKTDVNSINALLVPDNMLELGSLGAAYYQEIWADGLLQIACGAAHPREAGGLVLKEGERAAAAWASIVFLHDDPTLEAMGPEGLTDGHVLMVPVSALKRRCANPMEAAKWMGDGAMACAQVALGGDTADTGEWTVVGRAHLREVLAEHPSGERLLTIIPDAPEQDAWRYASAMLAYGNTPDGALTHLAEQTPETDLDKGWANQEWSDFLAFEGDRWPWKKNGLLRKGVREATNLHAEMLTARRTPEQKFRMTNLLLSQFGSGCSLKNLKAFLNGLVDHPECTSEDRAIAIQAASHYQSRDSMSVFNQEVEIGWTQRQERVAEQINAMRLWMQGSETENEALCLIGLAGMLYGLERLDSSPGGRKADTGGKLIRTPTQTIKAEEGVKLLTALQERLLQTSDLPADAVHDLAKTLPNTACQWLLANPQNIGLRDGRTGEHFDIIESLTNRFDEWVELDGESWVAGRLLKIVSAMPQGHSFDVDTSGWLLIEEAAGANQDFMRIYEAASKIDPAFANKALMNLAMNPDASPRLIEYVVGLGGDPLASVDIRYLDDNAVPEKILDVGRRHENLGVRATFRRMAKTVDSDIDADKVVMLHSPRKPPGSSGP